MFAYFPKIYPDELFYSVFLRYHRHMGSLNVISSNMDFFGTTVGSNINFPTKLKFFTNQFPSESELNSTYIINNNTILPFFMPFIPLDRIERVIRNMEDGNIRTIYTTLGLASSSIFDTKKIKYCTKCIIEDEITYGESYFHRTHQILGNTICHKHKEILRESNALEDQKTIKIFNIDLGKDIEIIKLPDNRLKEDLYNLSNDIVVLLENTKNTSYEMTTKKYKCMMKEKGYMTPTESVRYKKLYKDFKTFYSDDFLDCLKSNINITDIDNWLTRIGKGRENVINPIKHLIFIKFLFKSIDNFLNFNKTEYLPFGKGPWPCLNIDSEHYKENKVNSCKIESDSTTGKPLGIFKCGLCGYVYQRNGPDLCEADRYRKKRKSRISTETQSESNRINTTLLEEQYKSDIIKLISKEPNLTRMKLQEKVNKQYKFILKNNADWLDEIIPKESRSKNLNGGRKVDWDQRDEEISKKVVDAVEDIIANKIIEQITIRGIARRINYLALQTNLKRLSKTQVTIQNNIESLEKYNKRKVKIAIEKLMEANEPLGLNEIVKEARISRSNNVELRKCKQYITELIERI